MWAINFVFASYKELVYLGVKCLTTDKSNSHIIIFEYIDLNFSYTVISMSKFKNLVDNAQTIIIKNIFNMYCIFGLMSFTLLPRSRKINYTLTT